MRKNALIFLTVFLISSCKEISFREPQPKGRRELQSIPRSLHGKYLAYQEDGELSQDTVIITKSGYRFAYFDDIPPFNHREGYDEGTLSDTLVFKSYQGYYFLNLYEEPEWLLRVIKEEKNGDLVYMAMEQERVDFNDYVMKLSLEIAVDSVRLHHETLYYIDPSPAKLVELIEKGYFSRTILKKIR